MHRRVRLATMSVALVAVVLLGILAASFAVQRAHNSAISGLERNRDYIVTLLDSWAAEGTEVTPDFVARSLRPFVAGSDSNVPSYIMVTLPEGDVVTAGQPVIGPTIDVAPRSTMAGAQVTLQASWWKVQWQGVSSIGLIGLAAVIAVVVAAIIANWQARRLAAPLVYLAASAEQLGTGQVRAQLRTSGVEEIDLVAEELARSAERLAARLAAERQFASDASHQLRTPLTAMSMRLEEIELLTDDPEILEEVRISLEQIERLRDTINELLSRPGRDTSLATLEMLSLAHIARQQAEEWTPVFSAARRRLAIEVPEDIVVFASPGALSQVIATLLENSVKHGGGTTTLRGRRASGGVVIEVGDEGAGVPDELAPHIFERNVTSGSGTGLGLAVARDLVAADGGRLELSQRHPAVFSVFLRAVPRSFDVQRAIPQGAAVDPSGSHSWRHQRG